MMKPLALLLLIFVFAGCARPFPPQTEVTPDMVKGEEYVGLVRNCSDCAISIPSDNSGGTLIVPSQSYIEYTTWTKNFTIEGYLNGKRVFCQKIIAKPKQFTFMCKSYDFVAEISITPEYLGGIAPCSPEYICPPEPECPPIKKKPRRKSECVS
jgi:hypothetical protein